MKKIIISTTMLLAVCMTANAQQQMKVLKTDGTVTTFNVEDVSKVYFEEDNGDGDDNVGKGKVNISNVFSGKKPKALDGKIATYDSDGLLVSLIDQNSSEAIGDACLDLTYEYGSNTRAEADDIVRMNYTYYYDDTAEKDRDPIHFDMKLNKYGFAESCRETYSDDPDYYAWYFDYDSDGHLTHIKRMTNDLTDEEHIYITWKEGNIVSTKRTFDYEETNRVAEFTVSYLKSDNTTIENKGCIMLFNQTLGVDMDKMQWAYYVGLLGKPTKNLPYAMYKYDHSDNYENETSSTFTWTLDSDGYPTKIDVDGDISYYTISSFTW